MVQWLCCPALLGCGGWLSPSHRCSRCLGTQASSNQIRYFADVQKPPSESTPAVSFVSLMPCRAAGEHCAIAGVRRVQGLPLSALHRLLASPVFSDAARSFLHSYNCFFCTCSTAPSQSKNFLR